MPRKSTIERANEDRRQGKAASTQAGEFVREEMEHVREGKHGAKNKEQIIAIGLSKARRAGVDLPPPKAPKPRKRSAAKGTRRKAQAGATAGKSRRANGGSPSATGRQKKKGPRSPASHARRSGAKNARP
jgi:hypothetical protein